MAKQKPPRKTPWWQTIRGAREKESGEAPAKKRVRKPRVDAPGVKRKVKAVSPDGRPICGARRRNGELCQRSPMQNGRCYLHGGATPSGEQSANFKHGRYSEYFQGRLASKLAQQEAEKGDPLDLVPELQVQRAMLAEYIEQISSEPEITLDEIKGALTLAGDVVRTGALIAKARNEGALTRTEILFILAGMRSILEKYVPDPEQRHAFIDELRALVPGWSGAIQPGADPGDAAELTAGAGEAGQTA